jgi:hypothetical protein
MSWYLNWFREELVRFRGGVDPVNVNPIDKPVVSDTDLDLLAVAIENAADTVSHENTVQPVESTPDAADNSAVTSGAGWW